MIKSMTGFGRSEYNDGKRNIIVEIRAVNHRYGDISIRMPRRYSFAEDRIKTAVKEVAKRGKVEVSVVVESLTDDDTTINLNLPVARQYYDNLKTLKKEFDMKGFENDISLQFLATLPDVLKTVAKVEDEEAIGNSLLIPVKEAVNRFDEMRIVEGSKLGEDLIMRGDTIRTLTENIKEHAPKLAAIYTEKLRDRIKELVENNVTIPDDRILMEAAIFADKSSITEELVRLDSHLLQLKSIILKSNQPDGKKLDFLVQEMHREANTIGAKANDIEITNTMLEIKSEIEKIREQVQNIE